MAFDGAYFYHICRDLREAIGGHAEKIYQPAREELILALRWRGGAKKLLLSASAGAPRMHFTEISPENPKQPPMFCMLLRKHIGAGRLVDVRQDGLERIVYLDFDATNEMGDSVRMTLAVEIMGRHSNIILIGPDGRIIDAIKRIDAEMSSVRQVLPGMRYELPPAQQTVCLTRQSPDEVLTAILSYPKDAELSKCILGTVQGFSPIVCREAAHFAARGEERMLSQLSEEEKDRLRYWLGRIKTLLEQGGGVPTMVMDLQQKPVDFAFLPIEQYGAQRVNRTYESFSALLDAFYSERSRIDRVRQRSHDLLTMLVNTTDRIARRVAAQKEELAASQQREELKLRAELLTANAYALERGQTTVRLQNYYDPDLNEIEIALDARLTPVQNAQKYYAEYRKAINAEQKLSELIAKGEEQMEYLDSVFDAVSRSEGESEIAEIRAELAETGYVKRRSLEKQKPAKLRPMQYTSPDGFLILVGRNNMQNDRLTLKDASKSDLWLHTQKIPGSHVIIVAEGREIPNGTIQYAAELAAWHSKARESAQVPVDYTQVRYVKKPQGAAPGKVIYTDYRTAYVNPRQPNE